MLVNWTAGLLGAVVCSRIGAALRRGITNPDSSGIAAASVLTSSERRHTAALVFSGVAHSRRPAVAAHVTAGPVDGGATALMRSRVVERHAAAGLLVQLERLHATAAFLSRVVVVLTAAAQLSTIVDDLTLATCGVSVAERTQTENGEDDERYYRSMRHSTASLLRIRQTHHTRRMGPIVHAMVLYRCISFEGKSM